MATFSSDGLLNLVDTVDGYVHNSCSKPLLHTANRLVNISGVIHSEDSALADKCTELANLCADVGSKVYDFRLAIKQSIVDYAAAVKANEIKHEKSLESKEESFRNLAEKVSQLEK